MKEYGLSIRCYYDRGEYTTHYRTMPLELVPKWVDAYTFTHPNVESITVKIWFHGEGEQYADGE